MARAILLVEDDRCFCFLVLCCKLQREGKNGLTLATRAVDVLRTLRVGLRRNKLRRCFWLPYRPMSRILCSRLDSLVLNGLVNFCVAPGMKITFSPEMSDCVFCRPDIFPNQPWSATGSEGPFLGTQQVCGVVQAAPKEGCQRAHSVISMKVIRALPRISTLPNSYAPA